MKRSKARLLPVDKFVLLEVVVLVFIHRILTLQNSKPEAARTSKNFDFHGFKKIKLMMNAFVLLYFSYCPLIWMFHDRKIGRLTTK